MIYPFSERVAPLTRMRLPSYPPPSPSGMEESDMDKCHVMLGIPTNPSFGSLNLAAAVQLVAYDWRMAMGGSDSYGDVC